MISTPATDVGQSSSPAPQLRWHTRDFFAVALLAIVFFFLMRPVFMDPFYWDAGEIAKMASLIQQGHLNPVVKNYPDEGHPVLVHELYAAGWTVLGDHQLWWPHLVVFVFSFLTLLYSYRIGVWLGSWLVGFAAAVLIMLDPMFLSQSSSIHIVSPSVGLATAALYYLLCDQPKAFAVTGSLAALTYIPTSIFTICLIGVAVLLYWRGRRSLIWFLVPGFVLVAWLILHRFAYGYFLSDPVYWASGQRSVLRGGELLFHVNANLHEVFLRNWRTPFTVIVVAGGLVLIAALLLRMVSSVRTQAAALFQRLGGSRSARLLLVLAVGAFIYLPTVSAVTGKVLLGRYLMVLMVPLFLLAVQFLQATRVTVLWIGVCLLLGWGLHQHWYDHKSTDDHSMDETLLCRRIVRLEREATRFLTSRFPDATILAGYPHDWELADPVFGYVDLPMNVMRTSLVSADAPVDLVYYSTMTLPNENQRLFAAIDRQGARPIQSFTHGDIKIVILKTGENRDAEQNRYTSILLNSPIAVSAGEIFEVSAAFQNLGRNPWAARGDIAAGYRWELDGQLLPSDGRAHTQLQQDILWGETAMVKMLVRAPQQVGRYVLVVDLVGPEESWFGTLGNEPVRTAAEVR